MVAPWRANSADPMRRFHSELRPLSVAAASLLPPPETGSNGNGLAQANAGAAPCRRRLQAGGGPVHQVSGILRYSRVVALQNDAALCRVRECDLVSERYLEKDSREVSWKPSARRPSTANPRLILAGAERITLPGSPWQRPCADVYQAGSSFSTRMSVWGAGRTRNRSAETSVFN